PEISWRDKILGRRVPDSSREEDFKLLDGDVTRSTVNGIPAISFLERDSKHVKTVLTIPPHGRGKWYLTVQPWTLEFDLLWAFPSNAMVWVRLLSLPGFIYKCQFLAKIGGLIRTVIKLDFQKDNGLRRKFARMAGPTKEMVVGFRSVTEDLPEANKVGEVVEPFGPWMIGDFSSTKNHGGSFRDKKNNGAVVVNENTFSVLGQNNMKGLDFLDGAERREVSKPAREGSNKLFGSPIKSPSLDKKALENAGKIMAVGPDLTTQGGGGSHSTVIFKENRDFKNFKSTKVGSLNGRGKGILISKGRGFRNKGDTV
ncbi:hypothetical protein Goklo_029260, partial [Gossypium klotzschianum]|nr:hypothetical protein [Gossypium klotzschianum]